MKRELSEKGTTGCNKARFEAQSYFKIEKLIAIRLYFIDFNLALDFFNLLKQAARTVGPLK
jgi:hypothetical protein